jgi:elongation factor Ts
MQITAKLVSELRQKTGAGMMDCKKALKENDGSIEQAIDFLRKKGLSAAERKSGRIAAEGSVSSYIHGAGKIGVLLEINCETDFVARNDDFKLFNKDVSMHIAAANPQFVSKDEIPEAVVSKEREILAAQAQQEGKPANVIDKMVEGRLRKYYKEVCLLDQPFVKDPDKSIDQLLNEFTAKIGEKISIRRFVRWQVGEGIEKKQEDFAAEVAAAAGAN